MTDGPTAHFLSPGESGNRTDDLVGAVPRIEYQRAHREFLDAVAPSAATMAMELIDNYPKFAAALSDVVKPNRAVPWEGEVSEPEEREYVSPPDNSELRPLKERLGVGADYIGEIDRELPVSEWPSYRARLEGADD